jgi:hypothetical protein
MEALDSEKRLGSGDCWCVLERGGRRSVIVSIAIAYHMPDSAQGPLGETRVSKGGEVRQIRRRSCET